MFILLLVRRLGLPTSAGSNILYYTILYYTVLYYIKLYYTILYYTILYYTILYYTQSLNNRQVSSRIGSDNRSWLAASLYPPQIAHDKRHAETHRGHSAPCIAACQSSKRVRPFATADPAFTAVATWRSVNGLRSAEALPWGHESPSGGDADERREYTITLPLHHLDRFADQEDL